MSCSRPRLWALALIVLLSGVAPSCKDKKERVAADLGDAGFTMSNEDWFRASRENNVEVLKKFISSGFPRDTKDASGNSALHAAVGAGAKDSTEYLLNRGLDINSPGAGGRTPLMVAVNANQRMMVNWLLRQGADPRAKDADGFSALQLAVREGKSGPVEELAPYDGDLDAALLLAALLGKTEVIDSLTNFGASIYARMGEDRTPLMVAAQNGHMDSVRLLLDIGSSRQATNADGKTASDLAIEAGHVEIAAEINREPSAKEMALESPEQVSAEMDEFVAAAEGEDGGVSPDSDGKTASSGGGAGESHSGKPTHSSAGKRQTKASRPIEGVILGAAKVSENTDQSADAGLTTAKLPASSKQKFPLIMRHYREADVPIEVAQVSGDTATFRIAGKTSREVRVKSGESIPGSNLMVIQVRRRMEDSKSAGERPMEVSVVEVADRTTGIKRQWISGRQSTAHDPIALVEDPVTGERYTAKPGQRFKSAEGDDYLITDVRPNQVVIQDLSNGTVQTVPLKGPRG